MAEYLDKYMELDRRRQDCQGSFEEFLRRNLGGTTDPRFRRAMDLLAEWRSAEHELRLLVCNDPCVLAQEVEVSMRADGASPGQIETAVRSLYKAFGLRPPTIARPVERAGNLHGSASAGECPNELHLPG